MSLPKFTSPVVSKFLKPLCRAYSDVVTAYHLNSADQLKALVPKFRVNYSTIESKTLISCFKAYMHNAHFLGNYGSQGDLVVSVLFFWHTPFLKGFSPNEFPKLVGNFAWKKWEKEEEKRDERAGEWKENERYVIYISRSLKLPYFSSTILIFWPKKMGLILFS